MTDYSSLVATVYPPFHALVSCKAKEISSFLQKLRKQHQKSSKGGPQCFFMAYSISKSWKNRAEGRKVEWQAWPRSLSFHTALALHIARSNRHFQTLLEVQHQKWKKKSHPCFSFTYCNFVPTIKEESWTNAPPKLQNGVSFSNAWGYVSEMIHGNIKRR